MDAHEGLAVVRSVMTPTIYTISPSDSAQSAARLMAETGVGFLPVEYPPLGAILGVISDRCWHKGCRPQPRFASVWSSPRKPVRPTTAFSPQHSI